MADLRPPLARAEYLARARADLRTADPVIGRLIDEMPGLDVDAWRGRHPADGAFHTLLHQIVGQQLSVKAAATILGRVRDRFGGELPSPEEALAAPVGTFRGLGVSTRKESTVREVAHRCVDGRLSAEALAAMTDDQVIAELTAIPGIGRWTAHGFLDLGLLRTDVVPSGDLVLRKSIRDVYELAELPTPAQVEAIAEAWRPHRGLAADYLFAHFHHGEPPG